MCRIIQYLICVSMLFWGCSDHCQKSESGKLKAALNEAGPNKAELLKLMKHYATDPADSLKLKAVVYYLNGLRGHQYQDSRVLRGYLQYSALVKRSIFAGDYIRYSFQQLYGPFDTDKFDRLSYLKNINADSLIQDIDFCFMLRAKQPWTKRYDFTTFCENVLPYFLGDEIPHYNRIALYKEFNPLLDSLIKAGGTAKEATDIINEKLKQSPWLFSLKQSEFPHLGADIISKYRVGSCREMADLGTYVMRSVGLAVGNDCLPQWPDRSHGHNWNFLLTENGKNYAFLGNDASPSDYNMDDMKKGKVYRSTFYRNDSSLAVIKGAGEVIPNFFNDPFIKDVTQLYAKCSGIKINLSKPTNEKHLYLCVYDNKKWVPVDWAPVQNSSAKFKNVETGNLYLTGYFRNDMIEPASPPFIARPGGDISYLDPKKKSPYQLPCAQICKFVPEFSDARSLLGGEFQGANNKDFSDAESLVLLKAPIRLRPFWNTISIRSDKKFRYIRYYNRKSYDCNIAELTVIKNYRPLSAKAFGAKPPKDGNFIADHVTDNNLGTAFLTDGVDGDLGWIALDLGSPTKIDSISFAAGMHRKGPEMLIVPGHTYQLMVWKDGDWKLLSEQKALSKIVNFQTNITDGLFKLHDLEVNVDERPFVFSNRKFEWY